MLLTNMAIAQRIAVHLPEQALLRRHDAPIERRLVSRAIQYLFLYLLCCRMSLVNVLSALVCQWILTLRVT